MPPALAALDALRARIRELEGHHVHQRRTVSGVAEIDELVGGLPTPGLVELHGAQGSGRIRLAAELARSFQHQQRPVAWVDPRRSLYPPGLQALGVDLRQCLLVQPPSDRDDWAVEQLARSGCFPLVIVVDPPSRKRMGPRWAHAAEAGLCVVLVLNEQLRRDLPACMRLQVHREHVSVVRDRNGPPGRSTALRPPRHEASPWS